jgi:ribosomal protein S10
MKQYQIEMSNRFAALENLNDSKNINRAYESIRENVKTSVKDSLGPCELMYKKQWFTISRSKKVG